MKKWKLNLMVEILICVMQPIIWLVLFAILATNSIGNEMADRLREDHLKSSVYAVKEMMDLVNEDAFQLKGDELY